MKVERLEVNLKGERWMKVKRLEVNLKGETWMKAERLEMEDGIYAPIFFQLKTIKVWREESLSMDSDIVPLMYSLLLPWSALRMRFTTRPL